MAEWRFGRGWNEDELEDRVDTLAALSRNYTEREAQLTPERGWSQLYSSALIADEPPGDPSPGGAFEHAKQLLVDYEFSDPRIVTCHFDPSAPLQGRRMLLELRVLGLRYLSGTMVDVVREEAHADHTIFGYRYVTLQGHIESGAEWFLLDKAHATGAVRFSIHAMWRRGELPNWWSAVGFRLLARHYQRAWHRLAYLRLRKLLGSTGLPPVPHGDRLVHEGRALPLPSIHHFSGAHPTDAPDVIEERATR